MQLGSYRTTRCALLLLAASLTAATAQQPRANGSVSAIPTNVLLRIMRAEDERRWDKDLASLLADKNAQVRKRAALAAGRIGDERAVAGLIGLLRGNDDVDVRQMAAFAIGEIESPLGADALIEVLNDTKQPGEARARAVEALGKIAAALPQTEEARRLSIGQAILKVLAAERKEGATTASGVRDRQLELLGLTAVLRARPADAGKVVTSFLSSADPRIRADAANTLARLRAKEGLDQLRMLLVDDQSPISRANAARALGAAEDKQSFDILLDRALHDDDLRVRVSAIRALGSLKDARATEPLVARGSTLVRALGLHKVRVTANPTAQNELLEIVATLGRVIPTFQNHAQEADEKTTVEFFKNSRAVLHSSAPEIEIAFARVAPFDYASSPSQDFTWFGQNKVAEEWRQVSSIAQGFGEIASARTVGDLNRAKGPRDFAVFALATRLCLFAKNGCSRGYALALPDLIRAYAKFEPKDLSKALLGEMNREDVIVRATVAELLGEQSPSDANTRALVDALPRAMQDKDLNDAALAILDALGKQKSKDANDAIKTALDSSDHLIRRRAVALLKANGDGDFSNRIGTVKTRNTDADYRRAIARMGKNVTATVLTSKGSFTIEFLPEDAPLTVDNFIQLARKGYYNGQTIPRVVPNFVIQGGDPRGDGSGGPGYSIRCEINEVPYERAAVGMALSGKDTGGSQWFVTHAPQPHLDGGYTVFGRVIRGMDVVDRIARGDIIRRVIVSEKN